LAGSAPGSLSRGRLLAVQAQVCIAAGDLDGARSALAELADIVAVFDTPYWRAVLASAQGRLELAEHADTAVGHLERTVEAWQGLGVPYEEATARTLLGQALRLAGDERGAVTAFALAAERFDAIGAHLDAQLVDGSARVRAPAGLTDREMEVLRLLAGGRTNNDIADELYLSAKTVSRHVSNIFSKIGVTTRAGATAFAFEHELVARRRA
jgi:DNA-binding CsgD family transcriptional regulator